MLTVVIPKRELFNEQDQSFLSFKEQTIHIEHSLVSISKWESKWKKPFLGSDAKSLEEKLYYIKCMTITQNVDSNTYVGLPDSVIDLINEYVNNSMTATTFSDFKEKTGGSKKQIITSELIYYWMIALNIPFECQKWHINRLLTLIKICNIKNEAPKKMSKSELAARNRSLNAARRQQHKTKG